MSTSADPLSALPHVALGHLTFWSMAVQRQGERVLDEAVNRRDAQVDAVLFVHTLRQFLRAATLVARSESEDRRPAIEDAITHFNARLPDVKDARDVLDHFDDYASGIGDLSHPSTPRRSRVPSANAAREYPIFYEISAPGHYALHVGPLVVDVGTAMRETQALHASIEGHYIHPRNTDEIVALIEQEGMGPTRAALRFLCELCAEESSMEVLSGLVTPQSRPHWGDFMEARREFGGLSIGSTPHYLDDNIACVKAFPWSDTLGVAVSPIWIDHVMFLTLVREGPGGPWLVHQGGDMPDARTRPELAHSAGLAAPSTIPV